MRALCFVSVLLAVARASAAPDDSARFDAAIALESKGDWSAAADALLAFAQAEPANVLAADALHEAAVLCDSRLYQPQRALTLYALLVERYPDDRHARHASTRRAELETGLRQGGDELATFERLLGEGGVPRDAARVEMAQFLVAHPTFALADRGELWLGHAAEAAGALDEAQARYEAALALHGAYASNAARARADLLLRRGRWDEARAAYEAMGAMADPVARLARQEGLRALRSVSRRRLLVHCAEAFLVAFALVTLVLGRGHRWPPAPELYFFAPVATGFALVGVMKGGMAAWAIALIAGGAITALWLAGAARSSLRARKASWLPSIALTVATVVVMVLIGVLAIYATQLTDFVLDTLREGPER